MNALRQPTVVLDTNIWSWLVDLHLENQFLKLERVALDTVVPPSVLLEVLRTPKEPVLRAIVDLVTHPGMRHPPTEAALEAEELVGEIAALRPKWLLSRPRTDRLPILHRYWQKRIWVEARQDPVGTARRLHVFEQASGAQRIADAMTEHGRANKASLAKQGFQMTVEAAVSLTADLEEGDPGRQAGWEGEPVEYWRDEGAMLFWRELVVKPSRRHRTGEDVTFADWGLPYLNRRAMSTDRADWNRFWHREVSAIRMPRNWLRSYLRLAQYGTKVTPGNPFDEQHASYLIDAEAFFTGDKRYARILGELKAKAPAHVATPVLLTRDVTLVQQMAEWVTQRKSAEGPGP